MLRADYKKYILAYTKIIAGIWFFGTLLEILFSSGFPLYWVFVGVPKLYTDFGVPSFHGMMNALYLQLMTMLAYLYICDRESKKRYFLAIILLAFWPVMMLGRGIFISAIIQMACIYFMLNKISFSRIFFMGVAFIAVIVLFGVLGDMRQTINPFAYLIRDENSILHQLPSGFLWFYVYLTAGLSNLFHNIDIVNPSYIPQFSFSNMLPSIVRELLGVDPRNDVFTFVDANLNTSTGYAGFVSDFGALGGVFFFGIIHIIICVIYKSALSGKPWSIFSYTVAVQIIAFSIFYDMFFLLPTLFQFIVCFGARVFILRKERQGYFLLMRGAKT